jgi:hypothetical protein
VDEIQVDVVGAQVLERGVDALGDALVPWVVQLGGEPDLAAGYAGGLDAGADFGLVLVGEGGVDVAFGEVRNRRDNEGGGYGGGGIRYPPRRALSTALPTSPGWDCHVPRPMAGILAPVFRVNVLLEASVSQHFAREEG